MAKFVCIHGHFYQPPRENPWLEAVEEQDSAAPFHDWNQRVTAECYAPNAAARVLNPAGKIEDIVNNYQRISFNFGPTLLDWMDKEVPEMVTALQEADRLSLERWGHGNAMAQVYNHLIMPLATRRDKLIQIRWGIRDFRHHFGRGPEGMWLAETAVDMESLELMAAEGIKFTILAPSQVQAVRPPKGGAWQKIGSEGVDGSRAYRVATPAGDMAVFFYQGPLSRGVAFEGLLDDGARFAARIKDSLPAADDSLLMLATDGESYGHHHRFGEMALAFALSRLEQDPEVQLINPATFLEAQPPEWEAKIAEFTSWSCPHGVERWRSNCGCALDPSRGWSQAWRAPLRQAVDHLLERLAGLLEYEGGRLLKDPWAARDAYVDLILDNSLEARREFLGKHQSHELSSEEQVRVLTLMESQRWGLFAATSCAWFF
ncbi:MAG: DUF3536 domain-containing protein, partial [Deltaproteobacteria bacterium]|nr:DUF3536 domain-containing protein [Deltaproteobacteria bacterium]